MTDWDGGTSVVDSPPRVPPVDARGRPGSAETARPDPLSGDETAERRARRIGVALLAVALVVAALLGVAGLRADHATGDALAARRSALHVATEQLAAARAGLVSARAQAGAAGHALDADAAALAGDQHALAKAQSDVTANGISIGQLDQCLADVQQALNSVSLGDLSQAASLLAAATPVCRAAAPPS